jgi:hypothetical protein
VNKQFHGVPVPFDLKESTFEQAVEQFAYLGKYGEGKSSELDLRLIHNRLLTLFPAGEMACYSSHLNSFGDAWNFYSKRKCVGMSRILKPEQLGIVVICPGGNSHRDPKALVTLVGDPGKVLAIIVPMKNRQMKEVLKENIESIYDFSPGDYQKVGGRLVTGS